ncbi:MAG TPA: M23 family metallopeptidase [Coriobacteriia bacterium]|jgi:hypothetical protein
MMRDTSGRSRRLLPLIHFAPPRLSPLLSALLFALLLFPPAATALALRVPAQTPLVTDVGISRAPGEPAGLALLYADGTLLASKELTASQPATFTAVTMLQGTHLLRVVVRSREGMARSPVVPVASWGTPAAPRLMGPVHAGLYPKCVTFPVYVACGANKLTAYVGGKAVWSRGVLPPVTVPVPLTLPSGAQTVELRAENPVACGSTEFTVTRPTWPVPGYYGVGSGFGMRDGRLHKGIDIHAPYGTPVVAAAAGTVIWAKPLTTYGGLVMIDHGGRMTTYYAHLSSIEVKLGQRVTMGQRIGRVGVANVSHLHFQLFVNADNANPDMYRRVNSGIPVDPYPYVVP